jgi:gamma-polyglutamate synthase
MAHGHESRSFGGNRSIVVRSAVAALTGGLVKGYHDIVSALSGGVGPGGGVVPIFIMLLAFVLGYWGYESWRHHRALRDVPIRIHVNGSRGKSSVVRLVAAALREAGIPTAAKTTGSKARYIHVDGSEEPVVRVGKTPNVCEQIGVLCRARNEGARAIVMECMAVRPDLQKVCEEQIMHSPIGVITNIRPDHLDVMGPTVADVAVALSSTVPRKGTMVLGDARYAPVIQKVCDERGTTLRVARPEDVPEDGMNGFAYFEHEENVATALHVTRTLGIDDAVAMRGMYKAIPDIGACTFWKIRQKSREIEFVNVFAANDLESTVTIWQRLGLDATGGDPTFALLNLRGDRIDRSLLFAEAVENTLRADYYVLVGDIPDVVQKRFERQIPSGRLLYLGQTTPEEVFDRIADLTETKARVGGIGNIGGLGHLILAYAVKGGGVEC